ncbi:hypothetical protein [Methanosarcina barkeri]|uniref:Chromosome segregation ATPase n=5 Tax=Methanosarcina TaxID=2207 RepID=A0A0E3QX91_METBA|nr:hypothetical protein [Methanosarcina barkeri]AKB55399.1 hypothetical protein MSBRM_2401 [Methanosarcina barkeri MS]AKB58883.1 hypothetical protein MSBR2_2367 [Methanosarcina barkeri 227]AKJ38543.1 hypothetical protein MCM1_1499 [Methanosarcina barkeri CM1]
MQDFIAISKEVIPLEKSTITIKNENQERRAVFEKMIQEIDLFEKEMRECIETHVAGVDTPEILEIKEKTFETSSSVALAKKNEKLAEIDNENKLDLMEMQQLDTRILSALSPFFEDSIYGAQNARYAFMEDKTLKGKQVSFIDNLQYEFELLFTQDTLKVKDLQNLTLPIWSKGGILSREEKVKKIDVSDFYIKNIKYEKNSLKTVLEDKDAENKFTISSDEKTFLIMHRDYEITRDQELAAALNRDLVDSFITKLKGFFTEFVGSKKLINITLDGKNVIKEDRVFDCLKLIASIYGRLVKECLEKGYTEEEITIKIEEPGGTRTEKYLEKSEILRELSTIGKEGEDLATLLRVKEA